METPKGFHWNAEINFWFILEQICLFDLIKKKHDGIDVNKCLMVGDLLTTDIAFGINNGMKTALVMTGTTTDTILEASDIKPTFVLPSISDLL